MDRLDNKLDKYINYGYIVELQYYVIRLLAGFSHMKFVVVKQCYMQSGADYLRNTVMEDILFICMILNLISVLIFHIRNNFFHLHRMSNDAGS